MGGQRGPALIYEISIICRWPSTHRPRRYAEIVLDTHPPNVNQAGSGLHDTDQVETLTTRHTLTADGPLSTAEPTITATGHAHSSKLHHSRIRPVSGSRHFRIVRGGFLGIFLIALHFSG